MERRTGDTIDIAGDYQYRAARSRSAVQRFWHYSKCQAIETCCPPSATDRVLDVGCGSGVVSDYLAARAAEVVAVDGNPRAVAFASKTFRRPNLRFLQALVDEAFAGHERFDKIYCLEVIEHVYWPQALALLTHIRRMLRPGGRVMLSTPNYASLWPVLEKGMDLLRLAPRMQKAQHVERYTAGRLRRLVREAGFQDVCVRSSCLAAPYVAPLSWRLAERVGRFEHCLRPPLGSILLVVLSNKE